MTDPISFDPYLGWVDVESPLSIPEEVHLITASDLLRYENLGVATADRINSLIADTVALDVPAAWADITGKPSTFAPSAHTHPGTDVSVATTSVQGAMSAADKLKLDNAVSASTYGRLVIRDLNGNAEFGDPLTDDDAANKRYVDTAVATGVGTAPFGHMGKTDGFQTITTLAKNTFSAAQITNQGVTFDNANDALVVPVAGYYRINFQHYTSGGESGTQIAAVYVNTTQIGISARYYKMTDLDAQASGGGVYLLAEDDKVSLHSEHTGSTVASWGTSGWNGTYLEVEYLFAA
jgi:hypothetical protein